MQINRTSAIRALAVLSVAFAAGHLVQSLSEERETTSEAAAEAMSEVPRDIQLLTAEAGDSTAVPAKLPAPLRVEARATGLPAPLLVEARATALSAPPAAALLAPILAKPPALETAPVFELAELTPAEPLPDPGRDAMPGAGDCQLTLDLSAEPGAMIGAMLLAPCHPGERVVLRHAGLAFTGQTTATGSLFLGLPALAARAEVEILFGNGDKVSSMVALEDFAGMQRFGVQWQATSDSFQLQAFEGGASYGDAGHKSADNPGAAPFGQDPKGTGYLSLLGDSTTDLPMLAEIYTFPRQPALAAEVLIEAAVTAVTCGHEMLGETLSSIDGVVVVTELTLAMPECDAVGDFLVLKNLVPDMTLAAAD